MSFLRIFLLFCLLLPSVHGMSLPLGGHPVLPTAIQADGLTPLPEKSPSAGQSATVCPCTVSHGAFSMSLPFFSGPESAVSFFSYGIPLGSCANTGFEQSNHLILMLYEDTGSGEVSFIFIADLPNDGSGGTLEATLACMPNSAYVAVSDDAGELTGAPPTFTGNFVWDQCCTDGGVVGGLGCGYSFTFRIDDMTGIDVITLLYGDENNPVYVDLPASECDFIFHCGGEVCCATDIELDAVIEDALCSSSSEGTIDLTVSGDCLSNPDIVWSNGETTEDLAGLEAGTYTVTVTDASGCSAEESFNVGVAYSDPVPVIDGPSTVCEGGEIVLSVNGNYTAILWSTGATDFAIAVQTPGTYSVTVTNEGGCTGSASVLIDQYPAPYPEITGPTAICPGSTIFLDAGPGFSLYEWSSGGYNQTEPIQWPGAYEVVVTNAFGCTGTDWVEIFELPLPDPFIYGPDRICTGQSALLEVDDLFVAYQWTTGDTVAQTTISQSGTYAVTVSNAEGCTAVAQWTVEEGSAQPPVVSGDSLFCAGDSVLLSLSGGIAGWVWSTGDSTLQILVGDPGAYFVASVDSSGCRDTVTYQVDTFPTPMVQIAGPMALCAGDTVMLTTGPGFTGHLWSNGETSPSVPVSIGGPVWVMVTDSNGCQARDTVSVVLWLSDTVQLSLSSCHPQDTGLTVTVLTGLNGCDSVVIRVIRLQAGDTSLIQLTSCHPPDTGVFQVLLTNQFGCDSLVVTEISFLEADTVMLTTSTCDASQAGWDTLLLSNQAGCDSIVLIETILRDPDTLTLTGSTCDPSQADTTVWVGANQWGCDSTVITAIALLPSSREERWLSSCLPADTGIVVQTLANVHGCDSIIITTTLLLSEDSCQLQVDPVVMPGACAGDKGSILLQAASGAFPVWVIWTDSISGTVRDSIWLTSGIPFLLADLPPGTYYLHLEDAQQHIWTDTVAVPVPPPFLAQLLKIGTSGGYDLACAGDQSGALTWMPVSGGVPPFSTWWSTGQAADTLTGLGAGAYGLTITDASGCEIVLGDTLTEPPLMTAFPAIEQDPCDGVLPQMTSWPVAGGVGPYRFIANGDTLVPGLWPALVPGPTRLEVFDAAGCRWDTLIQVPGESIFTIELGPDMVLEAGSRVTLFPVVYPDTATIISLKWDPPLCPGCLTPLIRAQDSSFQVMLEAINAAGCTAKDALWVEVIVRRVFIPTAFSPDGDGINDLFAPFGDPEVEVVDFKVYDRWGNAVYRSGGFKLGDTDVGWDGSFRGRPVELDVFVYAMLFRWPDGQERLFKGDVLIMR